MKAAWRLARGVMARFLLPSICWICEGGREREGGASERGEGARNEGGKRGSEGARERGSE